MACDIEQHDGIIPRIINSVFNAIETADIKLEFTVKVCVNVTADPARVSLLEVRRVVLSFPSRSHL